MLASLPVLGRVPGGAPPGTLPSRRRTIRWPRITVISITALAVFLPLGLIFYQSLLSAPFFMPGKTISLGAFRFIFEDSDFGDAFKNSLIIASGRALIAVPLGGILAFLMVRTDLPGRRWLEPVVLIPIFVSPMVLAFGFVVPAGPVGFYSVWAKALFGAVPWNVYSMPAIAVIAGLTHVPHVYLYSPRGREPGRGGHAGQRQDGV